MVEMIHPFHDNYEDLSKDDWELHKQSVREGINTSHITKAIPSDDIEKLQEISSQNIFDFSQRLHFLSMKDFPFKTKNVSNTDYAALFSSIKCFIYFSLNGFDFRYSGGLAGYNPSNVTKEIRSDDVEKLGYILKK